MPLMRVLALARTHGPKGLVVFDLDSTLLDNRPRQARILREYGHHANLPVLTRAEPHHWVDWSIRTAMANAGLAGEPLEAHVEPAKTFWRERFFTSEYCIDDLAIEGAVAYVHAIRDAGATVLYVTGRHEGMRAGTTANFVALGFPAPDEKRAHLLMKPTLAEDDDQYKIEVQGRIREMGQLLAAFDNEPAHANGYRLHFPDAIVVRIDTDHSGRPIPLLAGIEIVPHFASSPKGRDG
jgi:beta-phosphoglucomutase-like phosphatase (HAD superfamily)